MKWLQDKKIGEGGEPQPDAKGLRMTTQADADGKPTPGEDHTYEYDGSKWVEQ